MRQAIAVICYTRLHYFNQFLQSLAQQKVRDVAISEIYDLYIFQDGLDEEASKAARDSYSKHRASALNYFPNCKWVQQPFNLGIAFHYNYIENYLFLENRYDFICFFEDDMIIQEGYLDTLYRLSNKFFDTKVGAITAYGDFRNKLKSNRKHYGKLIRSEYSWGFGLFRDAWLASKPLVEQYLSLLEGVKYDERGILPISQWLTKMGISPRATSQDYVKQAVLTIAGFIRLGTSIRLGLYIGRYGVHFAPKDFSDGGFDRPVIDKFEDFEIEKFTRSRYRKILKLNRSIYLIDSKKEYFSINELLVISATFIKLVKHMDYINHSFVDDKVKLIEAAYLLFLNRVPENEAVIKNLMDKSIPEIRDIFINSVEFKTVMDFSLVNR